MPEVIVNMAAGRTDEQKKAYRRAVNKSHAQVYSTPESPVQYNAFDKELQLWVAACLYKGAVDIYRMFVGEMDEETAERHYREGVTLATTLQVSEEMWPADRVAFDRYWQESLEKVHIDDAIREYLYPIAVSRLRGVRLPGPVQRANERLLALYKLNDIIRTSTTVHEMAERAMDLIFECLPADRGVIMTIDGPDAPPEPRVVRLRESGQRGELAISRTIVDKAVRERVAILSRDATIDSRFKGSESIIAHDIRSTMCVPMVSKNNVHGIIFLDCRESVHAFTEEDLAFLADTAFASLDRYFEEGPYR